MMKKHSILAIVLAGIFSIGALADSVDIAIDLDTRFLLGGGPDPVGVTTQPGFQSWDLMEEFPNAITLTEQDVTFTVTGWAGIFGSGFSTTGGIGARLRSPAQGGGGGGAFDPLLRDFVWVNSFSPPQTTPGGTRYSGLLMTVAGLAPGEYRMTSWHYDAPIVELLGNRILIAIGNDGDEQEILEESFPLGTAPATYTFEVTEVGQSKQIYYLITSAINPQAQFQEYNTRLNGFTLVSVPEPTTATLLASAVLLLAGGCRGLREVTPMNRA